MAAAVFTAVAFGPTAHPGNFSVPHGLGRAPHGIILLPTDAVDVWGQATLYDATNVYLVASDTGLTGAMIVW